MITFACPSSQKKLSVKEDLADKKGTYPGCGQTMAIPALVALAANAEMPTLPPSLGRGQGQRTNALTHPLSGNPDATCGADATTAEPEPSPTPMARAWRSRTPLLVAIGLLTLMPLGRGLAAVILRVETDKGTLVVEIHDAETEARIKNGKLILSGPDGKDRYTLAPSERSKQLEAGPYTIRVEGADGLTLDTPKFTLKKGDQETVRVTLEPKAVVQNLDRDRQAAEYVLSIGGVVVLNDEDRQLNKATYLPREPFRLTHVNLQNNPQVIDAGLAHFKDCKNLTSLWLSGTQVSDAGLAHIKDCKSLTGIHLGGTQVSDAGLALFKDCKNLTQLELWDTQVSDAGLALFKDCKNLTELVLGGTQVSDAGLALFEDCKNLEYLWLQNTQVSNVGLAYLKDCKNLTVLDLAGTQVSDAGLDHFKDCKSLTHLRLPRTKVTTSKIEELKKALPACRIEWDGGVIEPKKK